MLNIGPAADLTLCPHRRSEDDPKKDSFSMVSSQRKPFKRDLSRHIATKGFMVLHAIFYEFCTKSRPKMPLTLASSMNQVTTSGCGPFQKLCVLQRGITPAVRSPLSLSLAFSLSLPPSLSLSLPLSFCPSLALTQKLCVLQRWCEASHHHTSGALPPLSLPQVCLLDIGSLLPHDG